MCPLKVINLAIPLFPPTYLHTRLHMQAHIPTHTYTYAHTPTYTPMPYIHTCMTAPIRTLPHAYTYPPTYLHTPIYPYTYIGVIHLITPAYAPHLRAYVCMYAHHPHTRTRVPVRRAPTHDHVHPRIHPHMPAQARPHEKNDKKMTSKMCPISPLKI